MSELAERMNLLQRRKNFIEGKLVALDERQRALQAKTDELDILIIKLDKVKKVFAALVEKLVLKNLQSIDTLVTYGLNTVFPDRNLVFKSEMVEVSGKMQVYFQTLDNGVVSCDDTQGSVSVVESLILRMICMTKLGSGKLLLLDETFGAIDQQYLPNVGLLMNKLADKMKFDILLITFNTNIPDVAALHAKLNISTNTLSVTEEGRDHEKTL